MSAYLVLLGGLAALLVAGHLLVSGSVLIGRRFGLTPTVIGLTIVAAGTSAPELAVFARAIQADDTELAVGSVVGSNIANVLLVLGLVAALGTVRLARRVVRIDVPVMITASVLLLLFALDGLISPGESAVLVTGVVIFIAFTVRSRRSDRPSASSPPASSTDEHTAGGSHRPIVLGKGVGLVAAGAVGLVLAADQVVAGAEQLAVDLGVPELIVGLTVVALGTSAPEIVTSLVAAARGQRDLAVGNAVGSNIFNILLVMGLSGLFARPGIALSAEIVSIDLPIMVAAAVACLPVLFWDHKLDRWEGLVFLSYYAAYTVFLILTATDHGATGTYVAAMIWFVAPITALAVATIVLRDRRSRHAPRSRAGTDRPTTVATAATPNSRRPVLVLNAQRSEEASTWTPSHTNPLLLMRPSRAAHNPSGRGSKVGRPATRTAANPIGSKRVKGTIR